ncbi:UNVERIFIED_ORG: hypothetical protein J2X79_004247 [Arthrobacter globiformis]|nr:hypothetical protein [Arthrobacter globiformis]
MNRSSITLTCGFECEVGESVGRRGIGVLVSCLSCGDGWS